MVECLKTFRLGSVCVIGRGMSADVLIRHESVSGKHCTLKIHDTGAETEGNICTITDHSSNGTWVIHKETVILLTKHEDTFITIGDVIMLLSPHHSQSTNYQFTLQKGIVAKEFVLCRLPHNRIISKRRRSSFDNEISTGTIKKTKTSNNDVDCNIKLVNTSIHNKFAPVSDVLDVTAYVISEAVKPVLRPSISSKLTSVSEPLVPFRPLVSLTKQLSKEQCPICTEYFDVIDLVNHVDECTTITTTVPVTSSTTDLPLSSSTLLRQQSEEQCPKCSHFFNIIELISHVKECISTITPVQTSPPVSIPPFPIHEEEHCQFCLKLFPVAELFSHGEDCPGKKTVLSSGGDRDNLIERCMRCFKDFPLCEIVTHGLNCKGEMMGSMERFKEFLPSIHDVDAMALSVLTPTQQDAVDYVRTRSKDEASDQYPALCTRVIGLGYTPKDLQKVLHWVRHDAPIIIHLNLDNVLHNLLEDTHYRNLFEVHHSRGSTDCGGRRSWEDRMFNKMYHSSPPVERVKYGVLNIVGDPNGVRCCYSYGDSFLQLKKVRLRTTFASMDSSSSSVKLSCCEHYGNVLNEYSDPELKAILDVATHKEPYLESTMIVHYKEIQIHGPVCLSENVDCIVVSPRHRGDKRIKHMLDKFVEKNECNLIWRDASPPSSHGMGVGLGFGTSY